MSGARQIGQERKQLALCSQPMCANSSPTRVAVFGAGGALSPRPKRRCFQIRRVKVAIHHLLAARLRWQPVALDGLDERPITECAGGVNFIAGIARDTRCAAKFIRCDEADQRG